MPHGQGLQHIQDAQLRRGPGLILHPGHLFRLHHAHGHVHQVADDGFHVPAHVAHFRELGGLHLDEGGLHQLGQTAGDLGLAHAGGADHDDVFGHDLFLQLRGQLLPAPAVAHGHGHAAFGRGLADDVPVQLGHDLTRRELFRALQLRRFFVFDIIVEFVVVYLVHVFLLSHQAAHSSSTVMLWLVYTQMSAAICRAFSAISVAVRSFSVCIMARAAARA